MKYWELWSTETRNLGGCFDTREQVIEGIAGYLALYGAEAVKWVLTDVAILCDNDEDVAYPEPGTPGTVIEGHELFAEAITYG